MRRATGTIERFAEKLAEAVSGKMADWLGVVASEPDLIPIPVRDEPRRPRRDS